MCVRRRSRQNLNFGVFPQKSLFWGILAFWAFLAILADPPISPISPILVISPTSSFLAIFAKTQFFAILAIFPILAIFDYWVKMRKIALSPPQGKIVKIVFFCVFVKLGDLGKTVKR